MEYFFRLAHPATLFITVPLIVAAVFYRLRYYRGVLYHYPLTNAIKTHALASSHPHKKILFLIRLFLVGGLAVLIGKPQYVDPRSTVSVEGVDILLVLDVSGSMNMPHHDGDKRSRIEVAKEEAMRFVSKRVNDAIGIVVFGNDALTRVPLTADKAVLRTILKEVDIGMVNPEGTLLATAVITAANRLKQSHAKSKIMILLTDGEPSEYDADPNLAIEIAQKLGIKIYTIGIGNNQEMVINHPFYGPIVLKTTLNKPLLEKFAQKTGGKFFEAKKAHDMRTIYDTIDALEKTEITAPIFNNYYDVFIIFLWVLLGVALVEVVLRSLLWFSL